MNIQEIKDLMAQFDASSLREFSFKTNEGELAFSKNEQHFVQAVSSQEQGTPAPQVTNVPSPVISRRLLQPHRRRVSLRKQYHQKKL